VRRARVTGAPALRRSAIDGYWDDLDKEILEALEVGGPMDPAALAQALRMEATAPRRLSLPRVA
jgi:hypothetical protein